MPIAIQRICVGTMRVGELTNPLTWLLRPPVRHYFVHPDEVQQVGYNYSWLGTVASPPNPNETWLVTRVMSDHVEGNTPYILMYDTKLLRLAYIGTVNSDDKCKSERLASPIWEEVKSDWDKNTIAWLKAGHPANANYCT